MKLIENIGKPMPQLEYAKAIGNPIYALKCTRLDIPYAVGKLSRYTNNPSDKHWHAIRRVLRYLKKTIKYGVNYSRYLSVLEG